MSKQEISDNFQSRRKFLQSAAAAGTTLIFSPMISTAQESDKKLDEINVAVIGVGEQGQALINACRNIPGISFKALCDIWVEHNLYRTARVLKYYGYEVNQYEDYKKMLAEEKGLDAVLIATPDFWHSEHTVACLEAGLNVYCEKEMSNTLEGARKMVEAARKTGKLLQIGHQRRSNPKYIHSYKKLIKEANLLGQITAVNGQWNKMKYDPLGWAASTVIPKDTLEKYGYNSMTQFRNWRWYKGLGGGPIADLGSHQIDIYNWFLEAFPKNVFASGRNNYYDKKTHEWYDTVMAIYEYDIAHGGVTAFYQSIHTNSRAGYYEAFLGTEGMLNISESKSPWNGIYRERWIPLDKWEKWCDNDYIKLSQPEDESPKSDSDSVILDIGSSSLSPVKYDINVTMDKRVHQPHLENFFDAIRGKAKLNCPAEIGYETAVTVLKVNEAIEAGSRLEFKPEEFKV